MEQCTKSILVTEFGGYDALKVTQHPLLKPKENEIEVQVYYCGLNFADLYTRQGLMPSRNLPFVLGMECSGVITELGPIKDHNFKLGDRVICYNYTGCMYRYKVVLSPNQCYAIPENVSLKDAAAMFVNYLTAYFSVMRLGNLQPKQHILINSCAGGVGWAATQLASLVDGVTIYGTTSSQKTKLAKANGVNYVMSYENLKEQVKLFCPKGLDVIIDNAAGDDFIMKKQLLNSFGKIVFIGANNIIQDEKKISTEKLISMNSDVPVSSLIVNSVSVAGLHLGVIAEKEPELMRETLNILFNLLEQDKIKPKIDSVWPFEEIIEATRLLQERSNVGKVLLSTGQESL